MSEQNTSNNKQEEKMEIDIQDNSNQDKQQQQNEIQQIGSINQNISLVQSIEAQNIQENIQNKNQQQMSSPHSQTSHREKAQFNPDESNDQTSSKQEFDNATGKVKKLKEGSSKLYTYHNLENLIYQKRERKEPKRLGQQKKDEGKIGTPKMRGKKIKKQIQKIDVQKLFSPQLQKQPTSVQVVIEQQLGVQQTEAQTESQQKTEPALDPQPATMIQEENQIENKEKPVIQQIEEEQQNQQQKEQLSLQQAEQDDPEQIIEQKETLTRKISQRIRKQKQLDIIEEERQEGDQEQQDQEQSGDDDLYKPTQQQKRGRKKKQKKRGNPHDRKKGKQIQNIIVPLKKLNKIFNKNPQETLPTVDNKIMVNTKVLFKNFSEQYYQIEDQNELEELQKLNSNPEEKKEPCPIADSIQTDKQSRINMRKMQNEKTKLDLKQYPIKNFLNCDLKYFNLDVIVEKFGHFDVILMDPPWRIKGGQQNDSQFMFSNSKFNLEYNTMSNQEIIDLRIDRISKKGFLFLWILNTQLNVAYEMMSKWGYEVVDQIIWVKLKDNKIYLSHGYYFMHSFEICLVGFKTQPGEHVEYHSKVSNNLIFAEVRKKSQKPDELYEIIDLLMPGSRKIELFARNNNLRPGWFALGNQLGETFEKWNQTINCNECNCSLTPGKVRYKSKKIADFDICQECLDKKQQPKTDFFELENKVDEDILHFYHKCDFCGAEPIWGIRFECTVCPDLDLCEQCVDKNILAEKKFHDMEHELRTIEVPLFANGFPVHQAKWCHSCFQRPIIGVCFSCKQCANFHLCQQCFFAKSAQELSSQRGHKPDHKMEYLIEPEKEKGKQQYKCSSCQIYVIEGAVYKCENCVGFYFCEKCYLTKKNDFKTYMATSHKNYHKLIKVQQFTTNNN